jgi:hypothetical protein
VQEAVLTSMLCSDFDLCSNQTGNINVHWAASIEKALALAKRIICSKSI